MQPKPTQLLLKRWPAASGFEAIFTRYSSDLLLGEQLAAQGFVLLPILPRHIEALRALDIPHPDPFDRLLIAQAQDERLTLLTRDAAILLLGRDGVVKG